METIELKDAIRWARVGFKDLECAIRIAEEAELLAKKPTDKYYANKDYNKNRAEELMSHARINFSNGVGALMTSTIVDVSLLPEIKAFSSVYNCYPKIQKKRNERNQI